MTLVIVGGFVEACGIAVTIFEIRDRLRSVRHLTGGGHTFRVSAQEVIGISDGAATLSGPPSPVETRLTAIEAKLAALPLELKQLEVRAIQRAGENTRRGLNDLQHNQMQYVDRLRNTVSDIVGGGWRAYLGPGLIVIGFAMQIASNIIQIQHPGGAPLTVR